ncbi:MAG: Na+/solute symporter, partial [uncultured Frankineae bacterium]
HPRLPVEHLRRSDHHAGADPVLAGRVGPADVDVPRLRLRVVPAGQPGPGLDPGVVPAGLPRRGHQQGVQRGQVRRDGGPLPHRCRLQQRDRAPL